MTTFLLVLLLLLGVQTLRYRQAYKSAARDCDQVADDYQDISRLWFEESERYEAALVKIAQFPYDDVKAIATTALAETGTIRLMKVYAPDKFAAFERECAECDAKFATTMAAFEATSTFRRRLDCLREKIGWRVRGWWENPS